MEDVAGWIAPIATALAAMITAANLGARITGIGFVVFVVGSIAWAVVGFTSDQPNLLYQNMFLCVVNAVGIWRWLGREARYEKGGERAAIASEREADTSLFPVSRLTAGDIRDADGSVIGRAVDAMASRRDGEICYLVVREGGVGGVGERLHSLRWDEIDAAADGFIARLTADQLRALPEIAPDAWPGRVPENA